MKYSGAIFYLVIGLAAVKAMFISGIPSINRTGISGGGSPIFPRTPAHNATLSSLFISRSTTTTTNNSNVNTNTNTNTNRNGNGTALSSNLRSLFNLPDPQSLIPDLSSAANTSNVGDSAITGLPDLSQLSSIPGLSSAIEEARDHVTTALQLGTNFTAGIEQAIQDAFSSEDPTAALRTIVQTILNAYVTAAANCPFLIIGSRVIQEGIRLAIEVARSAQNVILGTTSATIVN